MQTGNQSRCTKNNRKTVLLVQTYEQGAYGKLFQNISDTLYHAASMCKITIFAASV